MSAVVLIPLIVVVVALAYNRHMLEAGLLGAVVAMFIGRVGIPGAVNIIMQALPGMLTQLTPIMYSATAIAVGRAGGFAGLLQLLRKGIGNRMAIVAGAIVLIQALATYAAGLGAGNTMVTGPLALAAVGAVPEMVAGMAIATAAGFETSPSSAETAVASRLTGTDPQSYSDLMRPYALLFWALGAGLAIWGVARRGKVLTGEHTDVAAPETTGQLWRAAIPALYFIVVVVAGKYLNAAVGWHLFVPVFNIVTTLALVGLLNPGRLRGLSESLVEGSSFILTRLFAIGLFLGFVNIMGQIGTFQYIAQLAARSPRGIITVAAAIAGFLVSVPAGAYSVGVISLVVPAMAAAGLTTLQVGLVCIAIGLGTQVSLVQINVAALAQTFGMDTLQVVKNNLRYVPFALLVVLVLGLFVHG